jgi:putative ABC transport system substrate-binding protein
MLRILPLLILVSAMAAAAEPSRLVAGTQRIILYLDADSAAVKSSIAKFAAALERRGITARHAVSIRHVAVDVFKRDEAARIISAALRDRPALVIATSSESAAIAREATADVPIVFGSHQDPVRLGLVRSLADPGANLTGFTYFSPIDLKRLELLREIAPGARRLGIVIDHWWMDDTDGGTILRAAKADLGFEGRVFLMERVEDLRQLQTPAAREVDAWYVPMTTLPFEHPAELVRALASLRKPVVFPFAKFAQAGGLAAYQPSQSIDEALDLFARLAGLVLDGVPPGTIPIERPKSFELWLNAAEARRLGTPFPDALLKRADRVIDETALAASR